MLVSAVMPAEVATDAELATHAALSVGAAHGVATATFVQTYATAALTHAAPTALVLTPQAASSDRTLVDVTTLGVSDPAKVNANFNDTAAVVNALIVDLANTKQLLNSVIDELQRRAMVG